MVKIISGICKNSKLIFSKKFYKLKNFSPTNHFVKKKIFNWLGDISKLKCLDLFSCSGSLGFEAASRGCYSIMIEKDKKRFLYLDKNKKRLNLKNVEIYNCNCINFLKLNTKKNLFLYNIIFIDSKFLSIGVIILSLKIIYELYNKKNKTRIYLETILNLNTLLEYNVFKNLIVVKNDSFNKINFFLLRF